MSGTAQAKVAEDFHQKLGEAWRGFSSESLKGTNRAHTLVLNSGLWNHEKINCCCFRPSRLWQPWEAPKALSFPSSIYKTLPFVTLCPQNPPEYQSSYPACDGQPQNGPSGPHLLASMPLHRPSNTEWG